MREWFTIGELRAVELPTFNEKFYDILIEEYSTLSENQARKRYYRGTTSFQLEFHVSLFTLVEQRALQTYTGGAA